MFKKYQIWTISEDGEQLAEEYETFKEAKQDLEWFSDFDEVEIVKVYLDDQGDELDGELIYSSAE